MQAWIGQLVPCGTITPFHAAVLLTLSSIPRLQQSAWSILKVGLQYLWCCFLQMLSCPFWLSATECLVMQDVLARSHQSNEQRQSSAWVSSLPQPSWGDADGIEAALLACIERCTGGWVTVIAPALRLATELISLHTKKGHTLALSFLGANAPLSCPGVSHHWRPLTLSDETGLIRGWLLQNCCACKQVTVPVAPHRSVDSILG